MTLKQDWIKETWNYIEYATIGTIADVMPLTGENRAICWFGLYKMRNCPNKLFSYFVNNYNSNILIALILDFSLDPC